MPCHSFSVTSLHCLLNDCRQQRLVLSLVCENPPKQLRLYTHSFFMCLKHKLRRQMKLCVFACLSRTGQSKHWCWHPWNVFLARLHSSQSSANSTLENSGDSGSENLRWPTWPRLIVWAYRGSKTQKKKDGDRRTKRGKIDGDRGRNKDWNRYKEWGIERVGNGSKAIATKSSL